MHTETLFQEHPYHFLLPDLADGQKVITELRVMVAVSAKSLILLVSSVYGHVVQRGYSGMANVQIVIAERFDRWIMTSNDRERWEIETRATSSNTITPSTLLPLFLPRSQPRGYEIASCICRCIWHRTSRAITAVKLDCRRLSPSRST